MENKFLIKAAITVLLFMTVSLKINAQSEEIIIQTTAQCNECKENIEKALRAEKGVRFVELDITTKTVKVVYNPKKTDPEALKKVISMVGYDADNIPADSAAVLRLSPCCTKDGHME
jgi:periplasmic mercuric ion binding protein